MRATKQKKAAQLLLHLSLVCWEAGLGAEPEHGAGDRIVHRPQERAHAGSYQEPGAGTACPGSLQESATGLESGGTFLWD